MSTPAKPATAALMAQLMTATRSGDTPLTSAPTSVSDAALVASPNGVKR